MFKKNTKLYDQNLLNITLNKLCGVINKFKYKRSSFSSTISAVIEANKITPTTKLQNDLAKNAKKNSLWSLLQSANTTDEPKFDLHWSYIPAKNKIEHLSIKFKKIVDHSNYISIHCSCYSIDFHTINIKASIGRK